MRNFALGAWTSVCLVLAALAVGAHLASMRRSQRVTERLAELITEDFDDGEFERFCEEVVERVQLKLTPVVRRAALLDKWEPFSWNL